MFRMMNDVVFLMFGKISCMNGIRQLFNGRRRSIYEGVHRSPGMEYTRQKRNTCIEAEKVWLNVCNTYTVRINMSTSKSLSMAGVSVSGSESAVGPEHLSKWSQMAGISQNL